MTHVSKSERFVSEKIKRWRRLRSVTLELSGTSASRDRDVRDFPVLYRLACADLAEARLLNLSPDIVEYLNGIVGEAHRLLHAKPPLKLSRLALFFKTIAPFAVLHNARFVLFSALLYFLPLLVTFQYTLSHPEFAPKLIPDKTLLQLEKSYQEGFEKKRESGQKSYAVSFYIQNNISVAFYSFAMGIFLGFGTIYFLIHNALFHGCVFGYICSMGLKKNLLTFVVGHAVFELAGFVMAGASGLFIGYLIIDAGKYKRLDNIKKNKERLLTLIGVYVFLTFTAALIEGCISPINYALWVKVSIGIGSLVLLISYFLIYPLYLKSQENGPFSFSDPLKRRVERSQLLSYKKGVRR